MRKFRITLLFLLLAFMTAAQQGKIAVFGSSVANGSGDTTGAGGYAGLLKVMMEQQGWQVVNVSKGGDNTTKILPRFETQLLPEHPDIVIIGLSLGNEGISNPGETARARVFEKYRSGLLRLIRLCRDNGMKPVVMNCYARNDFGPEQYKATREMNLLIHSWDVASINTLGTIDNGKGQWVDGFWHDRSHPDFRGHREMFSAFVPGMFEAIRKGKKVPEKYRGTGSYIPSGKTMLIYDPQVPVHSFAISFQVKPAQNGTFTTLAGDSAKFTIQHENGKIVLSHAGIPVAQADTGTESKGWQYITLSYCHAMQTLSFFVNGLPAGEIKTTLDLKRFILSAGRNEDEHVASDSTAFRELMIHRSGLNADEVKALYYDQLLRSSLSVYAPLNDPEFMAGKEVTNLAISEEKIIVQ
jgi:lysophospholipase L1-like esterase